MVSVNLNEQTEQRLRELSARAGLSVDALVEDAVLAQLDDLTDYHEAIAVKQSGCRTYSAEEVKRELDL